MKDHTYFKGSVVFPDGRVVRYVVWDGLRDYSDQPPLEAIADAGLLGVAPKRIVCRTVERHLVLTLVIVKRSAVPAMHWCYGHAIMRLTALSLEI